MGILLILWKSKTLVALQFLIVTSKCKCQYTGGVRTPCDCRVTVWSTFNICLGKLWHCLKLYGITQLKKYKSLQLLISKSALWGNHLFLQINIAYFYVELLRNKREGSTLCQHCARKHNFTKYSVTFIFHIFYLSSKSVSNLNMEKKRPHFFHHVGLHK